MRISDSDKSKIHSKIIDSPVSSFFLERFYNELPPLTFLETFLAKL